MVLMLGVASKYAVFVLLLNLHYLQTGCPKKKPTLEGFCCLLTWMKYNGRLSLSSFPPCALHLFCHKEQKELENAILLLPSLIREQEGDRNTELGRKYTCHKCTVTVKVSVYANGKVILH